MPCKSKKKTFALFLFILNDASIFKLFEANYKTLMTKKTVRRKRASKNQFNNSSNLAVKKSELGSSRNGEFETIDDTSNFGGVNDSSFSFSLSN